MLKLAQLALDDADADRKAKTLVGEALEQAERSNAELREFIYPTPFVRIALAFILLVYAVDLLCARRHEVRPMLRAALGRRRAPG